MAGPNDPQNPRRPGVVGMPATSAPVGVQAPKAPAVNPGFVDARPAAQVLRHPVAGYDYSKHPEFRAFMKATTPAAPAQAPAPVVEAPASARALEGQAPAGGLRSVPPAAQLPTIGVPVGGQLPAPGVRYPASQEFRFPAGYGHGYIEQNGKREHAYSSPEQQAAGAQRAAAYQHQQWDNERHGMIRDLHGAMSAMLNGANGRYGNLSPEERVAAMGMVSQQLGGLMQTDAHSHSAEMQYGNDPHRDPAYRQALIGHLNAQAAAETARGKHFTAEADAAAHPERQLDLMKQILMDPQLGPRYLALKGVSPAEQGSLPPMVQPGQPGQPAVHAGNLGAVLGQNGNESLRDLLAKPDMSLLERTRQAANMPGIGDPSHPTHQAFQAWMRQQYTDPQKWREDTYVPPDPDQQLPYLGRLTGLANAAWQGVFGDTTAGTGFNWRNTYQDRTALRDLLARLNLGDPTLPQRAAPAGHEGGFR